MALHEPPTMALHGSPASLQASPCFDKLLARPRADPRVLFRKAWLLWRVVVLVDLLDRPASPASPPATVRGGHSASREHSSSCSGDQPEYGCDRASRVSPRPPGRDPSEALLRQSRSTTAELTPPVQCEASVSPRSWLSFHVITHVFFSARSLTCCAWSVCLPAPPSLPSARCACRGCVSRARLLWFVTLTLPSILVRSRRGPECGCDRAVRSFRSASRS